MVWNALRPWSACLLALIFLVSSLPLSNAQSEPALFFADPFDDLDGWTFSGPNGGEWGLTDNRAHNGTSLHFGDDKGTPDPDDNAMPRCGDCDAWAVSPSFTVPADSPAFAYFWVYNDMTGFGDLNLLARYEVNGLVALSSLGPIAPAKDGFVKFDLAALGGHQVQLIIEISDEWGISWYEGLYIDHLLVTDIDVTVAHVIELEDEGNGLDLVFTVPEEGTSGSLVVSQSGQGFSRGAFGQFMMITHEGDMKGGFAFHGKYSRPNMEVNLLGDEVLQQNATMNPGGGGFSGTSRLDLSHLQPGVYRITSGTVGVDQAQSRISLYASGPLGAVAGAVGGRELAMAYGHDYDVRTALVSMNDGSLLMADGSFSVESAGPAVGFIDVDGFYSDAQTTTPDGPSDSWPWKLSDTAGEWRSDVNLLIGGDDFPYFEVAELPARPDGVDLPAPDLSALPGIDDGTEPAPEPEPAPWPDGYNVTRQAEGLILCQVAVWNVQSKDLCAEFGPDRTAFQFPLDNGTTEVALEVTTSAGPYGHAEVCAYITGPFVQARDVCSDEGRIIAWSAEPGEARTAGDETLEIQVRIKKDEGFAYMQPVELFVETAHWGGEGA